MRDVFGNASSVHAEGRASRRVLEESRESVATLVNASPREIVFTSGGTESNNTAIHGVVLSSTTTCHIVTSSIEHPSVLEPVRGLSQRGHSVTYVSAKRDGSVSADEVIAAIRPETRLVTMMLANNETGVIQPVAQVGQFCRARAIHFHCDAVQAAGKIQLDTAALYVDTLALSAHKIHAPKGVGALFVRTGVTLSALISGGMQERRRRAGTENVPLAAAFGTAARLAGEAVSASCEVADLRDRLEADLGERVPSIVVNGGSAQRIPNTSNILFRGADAESVVIALDLMGIAVSTGSACSSGRVEPSHVLLEMGLTNEEAKSSLRFSLSRFTSSAEIDQTGLLISEVVNANRKREMVVSSMTVKGT